MLVQYKESNDKTVHGPESIPKRVSSHLRPKVNNIPVKRYRERDEELFSPAWLPNNLNRRIDELDPEIVHLHWINKGFVRIEALGNIDRPIVWTLHDMWSFTGGCHYTAGCEKYRETCGACPQLGSDEESDLSNRVWKRKSRAWNGIDLSIVTPSQWLAHRARESSLFKDRQICVIPYCLDTDSYRPRDRVKGRKLFDLPLETNIVLFGADYGTPRKGMHHLESALKTLSDTDLKLDLELAVFGAYEADNTSEFGKFKTHYLGYLDEIGIQMLFSTADVTVVPSVQDNHPNIVLESLACGTPCVAFDIGGMPDMIDHRESGYLATPFDTHDLAEGIRWTLEDRQPRTLGEAGRKTVESRYTEERISSRYHDLYEAIL